MGTASQGGIVNTYIIWYSPSGTGWTTTQKTTIRYFLANLGGSSWWGLMGSYMDAAGSYVKVGPGSVTVAGEWSVSGGPASLTDAQIWSQVSSTISGGNLPSDPQGVYFLLTDATVTASSGFCSS